MRILVTGSRRWGSYQQVKQVLDQLPRRDLLIIHGGATGVDSMTAFYCRRYRIEQKIYLPAYEDSTVPRREAPLRRNEFMCCLFPDRVIAFWDGMSRGTKFTINYARRLGIPTEVWQ